MSDKTNSLQTILIDIKTELTNQIASGNNDSKNIDNMKLVEQSKNLDGIVNNSDLSDKNKKMMHAFALTLIQDNTTVKSLRYEKQDLERVLSNLNDS
ncbi:MAG: hypothetical protein CO032_05550 [Nitrosopumilales archaeon CG_4_9_14_0_2_um_filter_34_16]|jgi:hypothetical protein|nr:MAG: hypothetical protein CO032_05550 [Nitrosopumilales archaeon CG_4_9_14_0_2_um_filter_34_16]